MFRTSFAALGLALATLGVTAPASARDAAAVRTIRVPTADLDLRTERGARTLRLRVLHAASTLCGTPAAADPRGIRAVQDCRRSLVARATSQTALAAR